MCLAPGPPPPAAGALAPRPGGPASLPMAIPRITLVGYRGCGKSTIAGLLAARTGLPAIDLDAEIEARAGRVIPDIFAAEGEAAFRELERATLIDALAKGGILATGGGVVERPDNRELLRAQGRPVVYLHAPAAVLAARLTADDGGRPSLTGAGVADEVAAVLARREPWYREVADTVVEVDRPLEAVVDAVLDALG